MNEPHFTTRIIDAGISTPDPHGAMPLPVYRGAAFEFPDSESIAAAFRGETGRHFYSRVTNPGVAAFETKVRAASGAANVIALSSGMAAIVNTFLTIASPGSNVVTSPHLFGNTFSFFRGILSAFGVEIRWVDAGDTEQIERAVDENTCAFFAELVTNPHMEVAPLPAISKILRLRGVPMIIDTTIIPWCAFDARRAGVDVEIVSTTKYISGGGTATGGVIVDHGTADWSANPRLGAVQSPAGISPFTHKLRSETVRNLGAVMTPDTAAMHSLGLESLQVRYERMSATAEKLARQLEGHPKIARVGYPSLPSSPHRAMAAELFTGLPGAMFTASLGGQAECFRFMDALRVWHRATNLFDNRSLVIHPASTIYCSFTPEMLRTAGIEDNLVRFSAGLEDVDDLASDILQALDAV